MRVIGESGEQLGIMSRQAALDKARQAGVDLVEFSPNANPSVVKIIDWGKYQYQKMKEQQRNRRSNKANELKQMRFGLKIGANDLEIKLRKIRKFLAEGHKVKVLIFFRGREMAHQDLGLDLLNRVRDDVGETGKVESMPRLEGRQMVMMIAPR